MKLRRAGTAGCVHCQRPPHDHRFLNVSARALFAGVALLALAAPLLADAPGVYAIIGGTVHPVSGPELTNGAVIIRDGLIEAVGSAVVIPSDATIIDAKGKHVYPGLIDAQTSLGFPSGTPARRSRGAAPRPQSVATEQLPETSPAFVAMREAKLSDDDVDAKRATGVTTILTAPSFGLFNGQSVVLDLGGGPEAPRHGQRPRIQPSLRAVGCKAGLQHAKRFEGRAGARLGQVAGRADLERGPRGTAAAPDPRAPGGADVAGGPAEERRAVRARE